MLALVMSNGVCHLSPSELPEIARLTRFPTVRIRGRELRPIHFHRFRAKRGLTHPDTHGSFWRIEFAETANAPSLARSPQLDRIAEPVQGPLALGFGCNEGLGLFVPVRDA